MLIGPSARSLCKSSAGIDLPFVLSASLRCGLSTTTLEALAPLQPEGPNRVKVIVSCRDTGVGIPGTSQSVQSRPADDATSLSGAAIPNLFKPFAQVDS